MLKIILVILALSQCIFSQTVYNLGQYKSGTPYVRLKIPESVEQWTCFDHDNYSKFIGLAGDEPLKDSLLAFSKEQLSICQDNKDNIEEALIAKMRNDVLFKNHSDSLFATYEKTYSELNSARWQKYLWGAGGGVLGAAIGIIATLVLGR